MAARYIREMLERKQLRCAPPEAVSGRPHLLSYDMSSRKGQIYPVCLIMGENLMLSTPFLLIFHGSAWVFGLLVASFQWPLKTGAPKHGRTQNRNPKSVPQNAMPSYDNSTRKPSLIQGFSGKSQVFFERPVNKRRNEFLSGDIFSPNPAKTPRLDCNMGRGENRGYGVDSKRVPACEFSCLLRYPKPL